jgi:hypothetical protein
MPCERFTASRARHNQSSFTMGTLEAWMSSTVEAFWTNRPPTRSSPYLKPPWIFLRRSESDRGGWH